MLDRIVISRDRKTAILIYTNKPSVDLYSSDAKVIDLVWFVCFKPFESRVETFKQAISTLDDTQIIELERVG